MQGLDKLFLTTLKDVFYAEKQVLKALPKMARAADGAELSEALLRHREETQGQVERLQQVFAAIGKRAQGVTCEAMNGLIEECNELLEDMPEPGPVRDAGLIACARAVEHYEIARYGSLAAWAAAMGQAEAARLLEETLAEEQAAEQLLAGMATTVLEMAAADDEDEPAESPPRRQAARRRG